MKMFALNPNMLLAVVSSLHRRIENLEVPMLHGIPDGAEVVDVQYDFMRRSFMVIVSHDSFDEVADGEQIPFADNAWIHFVTVIKLAPGDKIVTKKGAELEAGETSPIYVSQ